MPMNVIIAKYIMNLMPKKPKYNSKQFVQEVFRHPNFKLLNEEEKKQKMIEFVEKAYIQETQKPLENFFPDFPFNDYFRNKIVLDVGCSIGGQSIYFAEKWKLKAIYGIDVNKESINTANIFVQQKKNLNANYDFKFAYAEELPFLLIEFKQQA